MPRSVAEIQAEIAKVKQEIAARDMYRQPQSRVGWATYVGTGDRGLLDAYQNREDQYNKMMKQQAFQAAEAALNRKFQEQENERNRQNALELTLTNKSLANDEKLDDYMRQRNRAANTYSYAQAQLDAANKDGNKEAIDKATLDLALAKHDLDYYNKKVGYKEPNTNNSTQTSNEESNTVEPTKTDVSTTKWMNVKTINTEKEKNDILKEIDSHPNRKQDKSLQEAYDHINSIVTKEKRKQTEDNEKKELNSYDSQYKTPDGRVRPGALQKLKDTNPRFAKLYKKYVGD